jgi:hypothetical protein
MDQPVRGRNWPFPAVDAPIPSPPPDKALREASRPSRDPVPYRPAPF